MQAIQRRNVQTVQLCDGLNTMHCARPVERILQLFVNRLALMRQQGLQLLLWGPEETECRVMLAHHGHYTTTKALAAQGIDGPNRQFIVL